jgi:hypothetical protein
MVLEKKQKKLILIVSLSAVAAVTLVYVFRKQIYSGAKFTYGKLTSFKKDLVKNVLAEYKKWDMGKIKEGDSRTMPELREYWKAVGWENKTDKTKINEAWSAAFISAMMSKAGAGKEFKNSASHSVYIRDSIKNRKNDQGKFRGYKPEEVKIEVGDLIGRPRQTGVTYDTNNSYKSHTDIVVEVTPTEAKMIGGNIGNSVSMTKVPLENGKIASNKTKKNSSDKNYHVVIKNLM